MTDNDAIDQAPERARGFAARGGNGRTQQWINDRLVAITAIHTEFPDPAQSSPPRQLVVNAIGDTELRGETMAIIPPGPSPARDYRHRTIADVPRAVMRTLSRRLPQSAGDY